MIVVAAIGATLLSACQAKVSTGPRAPSATTSSSPAPDHARAASDIGIRGNPGAQKWRFGTGGKVAAPAIGADGTIYVGSADFNLYAVAPDGTRKWALKTDGGVGSPVIGSNGTIYVGAGENLYAVNPDGTKKWAFVTGSSTAAPATGADGTIYVSAGEDLYAVNPDGMLKWKFPISYAARSAPAIGADGTIYVGSGDGNLYAINPDGTKKWAFATGSFVDSSPAIGKDGTIFVGSGFPDAKLYAVRPDGARKWAFASSSGASFSAPAIGADRTVYVGSYDGQLYAIGLNGAKKWAMAIGVIGNSAPAIGAAGTIYVGSDDYNLYALNPDGAKKWAFGIGSDIHSSPAIASDGTVYVGSGDNNLYAVGVAPPPPGMPQWDTVIGQAHHNDLPECQPGIKVPCQGKMVIAHPFVPSPQGAQPPQASSQLQHVVAPDQWAKDIVERESEAGKLPLRLPPAMAKWMESPEYKQWAATHGSNAAYWHCYDPNKKEYYGVKVPSLQTPPPAGCLPGPSAQPK